MALEKDDEGMPVQIVSVNKDHTFTLNEEALENILKDVKDLPVVVISIAGAMRQGKSFLLSLFIRYLRAKGASDWLGDQNLPLKGFSWKGGCEAETTGILMWSHAFQVQIPSGKTVAVLLMDTQGAFDDSSTVNDCATIFAISTLISSVQILNIKDLIKENDLQNLQIFTEYGKLALKDSDQKPFQKLLFLVRDWASEMDYAHGREGGKKYIDKKLEVKREQHAELCDVRRSIRACFEDISCFLMPHPGLEVARPKFKGCIVDIEKDFVEKLCELAQDVLAPENLIVKTCVGQQIKAEQLLMFFKEYMKVFQLSQTPQIQSMFHATAGVINMTAVTKAKELYQTRMSFELSGFCIEENALEELHLDSHRAALESFQQEPKLGGNDLAESSQDNLIQMLEALHIKFMDHNKETGAKEEAATRDAFSRIQQKYEDLVEEQLKVKIRYSTKDLLDLHKNLKTDAILQLENEICDSVGELTKKKLTTNLSEDIEKHYLDVQEQIKIDRELKSYSMDDTMKKLRHEDPEKWRATKYLSLANCAEPFIYEVEDSRRAFKASSTEIDLALPVTTAGLSNFERVSNHIGVHRLVGGIMTAAAMLSPFAGFMDAGLFTSKPSRRKLNSKLLFHECGMFELKPSFPLEKSENSELVDQWFKIVLEFLKMVLENRAMCVLTWNNAEDIFISEPLDYTIEKIDEMSYFKARMTPRLLKDACTSPQFLYSEMALTSPDPNIVDARKLRGCTKNEVLEGNVNVDNEYLCMTNDGGSLFWLNPAMQLDIVKSILKKNGSDILMSG